MANNLTKGEALLSEKTLNDNVPLFAEMFEVGDSMCIYVCIFYVIV